ncbi:MAG: hypothetical protein ACLR4Z_08690 [Butyricicoccaceae bacterium]
MKQLVDEREKNGIFTSFQDFCERMYDRELNRRALECLSSRRARSTRWAAAAASCCASQARWSMPSRRTAKRISRDRWTCSAWATTRCRTRRSRCLIFPRVPSASCSRWRRRRPDFICRGIRWTNTASLPPAPRLRPCAGSLTTFRARARSRSTGTA